MTPLLARLLLSRAEHPRIVDKPTGELAFWDQPSQRSRLRPSLPAGSPLRSSRPQLLQRRESRASLRRNRKCALMRSNE